MKKATIADVAELAGVSKATVSRYLKQENVREEIAEKIRAAIEETGYVARGSKTEKANDKTAETKSEKGKHTGRVKQKNYRLGVLVKDIALPRTRNIIHALKDVLKEQGITFSICVTDGMEELEEKYLTSYIVQNVNGIIIEGCSSAEFIQKQMRTTSIPVLFLNEDKEQLNCCCLHEVQAGEVLGAYMLKKQQLVVRYLGVDQMIADQRLQGIRNCYHEKRQPIDLKVILCTGSYADIYEKIKEIFMEKIDLLLLERDEMAIPLTKFAREYHIAIPQNASVISFGGHEICRVMSPALHALAYDYTAYARDIAAHMNALIEKTAVKEQTAAFSIFEGESVR